jgi:uncharacterized membrane protein YeiH
VTALNLINAASLYSIRVDAIGLAVFSIITVATKQGAKDQTLPDFFA